MGSDVTHSPDFYKAWAWFESNKKQVTYGAAVLIFVGLIVYYFVWSHEQKQIAAGQALSSVFVPQATGSAAKTEAASGYLKVASEYPKAPAGAQALLFAASSLYDQGKYSEAQAEFEKFTREFRGSPLYPQALLGIAASLDAQNKTNEALTAYKNVVDRYPNESVTPQGKFALGRLYEAQGKPDQALQLFEDLGRTDPYGQIGSEAGMRAEELKKKYPQFATPVQPVTAAPAIAPVIIGNSGSNAAPAAKPNK